MGYFFWASPQPTTLEETVKGDKVTLLAQIVANPLKKRSASGRTHGNRTSPPFWWGKLIEEKFTLYQSSLH